MRTLRIALAAVALAAAGFAAGYLYRRAHRPTLEEKVQGAGKDLQRAWDKVTK